MAAGEVSHTLAFLATPGRRGTSKDLTWQRADEFVDIFHIPFGGLAWQEVVPHAHQVPHVHVRELQVPLALSPAGGG